MFAGNAGAGIIYENMGIENGAYLLFGLVSFTVIIYILVLPIHISLNFLFTPLQSEMERDRTGKGSILLQDCFMSLYKLSHICISLYSRPMHWIMQMINTSQWLCSRCATRDGVTAAYISVQGVDINIFSGQGHFGAVGGSEHNNGPQSMALADLIQMAICLPF